MSRTEIVQAYLHALGLQGRQPGASLLPEILARHVATFPFANVGCLLGEDLPLDLPALFDRIVTRSRGGYCFEQNGLFHEVLEELGYAPILGLARVIYNQDTHPGLTHRFSLLEYGGASHVVDVGFGQDGPRVPVPMSGRSVQDGDRVYQVAQKQPGEYHLQIMKNGRFFSLYRFELSRYGASDCELGHFYSHRHPAATFVNNLVVSRLLPGEIRSLRNFSYRVSRGKDETATPIEGPGQLARILTEELDVQVTAREARRLHDRISGHS